MFSMVIMASLSQTDEGYSLQIFQNDSNRLRDSHHGSLVRRIGSNLPLATRRRRRFRNRSLIRVIGSSLPLRPCRRPYLEVLVESNKKLIGQARQFIEDNVTTVKTHVATLADIGLLWNDAHDGDTEHKDRNEEFSEDDSSVFSFEDRDLMERDLSISQISSVSQERSSEKIVALEEELARLREQIAMIVSVKDQPSTQARQEQNNVEMVPPPPPPPPPPTPIKNNLQSTPKHSTPKYNTQQKQEHYRSKAEPNAEIDKPFPSLTDVLQGLGSVKLRSVNVQRSPGGTPLRTREPLRNVNSTNPADIIANALRKKFAKSRRSFGSPANKENQISPCTGFSPTPPPTPEDNKIPEAGKRRRSALFSELQHAPLNIINENC